MSFCAALIWTLAACGGSPAPSPEAPPTAATAETPKPAETTPAPAASEAPAAPAHEAWSDSMTKDQQMAFMKKYVLPEMDPVFKGYNAKAYAKFDCVTCHGPAYKNPHDFLPKLSMKDGKILEFDKHPEVSKFMAEQVVPHMATAMGVKPYDPATKKGFGCDGCHTIKMK